MFESEIAQSVEYLRSNEAKRALKTDPYWPKWNSPWWHMLLLFEMGEIKEIPQSTLEQFAGALNHMPLKIFPIQADEMPGHLDPFRESMCHCQLGNVYQVLSAAGMDVDTELPWIRPWFLRYQMPDGGLNCDNSAYLVKDEVPSSMVGTIACFEAVLLHTPRPWTAEEKSFLDQGAKFLIERQLMKGSSTKYNADEQVSAEKWMKLCFPRFYFYDVLRGLNALLLWGEKTNQTVPRAAVQPVMDFISSRFPDGNIRIERLGYEGSTTLAQAASGDWQRKQPATFFPLLTKTSALDQVSPFLSAQWRAANSRLQHIS